MCLGGVNGFVQQKLPLHAGWPCVCERDRRITQNTLFRVSGWDKTKIGLTSASLTRGMGSIEYMQGKGRLLPLSPGLLKSPTNLSNCHVHETPCSIFIRTPLAVVPPLLAQEEDGLGSLAGRAAVRRAPCPSFCPSQWLKAQAYRLAFHQS